MQGLSCQASEFTLGIHPVAIKLKFGNTMSRTMAPAWSSRLRTLPLFFVVVILGLVTNSRLLLHWGFVGASGSKLTLEKCKSNVKFTNLALEVKPFFLCYNC